MGRQSRDKGKRGEREVANILKDRGFKEARRGQQYNGANGDADVVGIPGWHLEVKRTEHFSLYAALEQAQNDKRERERPVVVHRRNGKPWVVVLTLDDFLEIIREEGETRV